MSRPKDQLARGIGMAEAAIAVAYFDACDDAQAAIDPAKITDASWARVFLEDIYEYVLATEADPAAWKVARLVFAAGLPPRSCRNRRGIGKLKEACSGFSP